MTTVTKRRAAIALPVAAVVAAAAVAMSQAQPGKAHAVPATATTKVFATGGALTDPDDIALLDGHVFIAYQNGVGSKGEPSPDGHRASTVVEYSKVGRKVGQWNLTGKVDGMAADSRGHRIVATVNEDGSSSLSTISPSLSRDAVRHYRYAPSPLPHGGGTDSIASVGGTLYVTASAPSADKVGKTYSKPALYRVDLSGSTAKATSALKDNATAKDARTGKAVTLNLSDPDSSFLMPTAAPRFAGDLQLDSQGDSQEVFLKDPGTTRQRATVLKLVTQVDDTAVATSRHGTLLVVDAKADRVIEISGAFHPGEVFASVPDDSTVLPGNLGRLDLTTGAVVPFQKGFQSPKGLLFVR